MFKKWISLGVGLLVVLFLSTPFSAEAEPLKINNRILPSLKISLFSPETKNPYHLSGRAFLIADQLSGEIDQIQFRLIDSHAAETWIEKMPWNESFLNGEQVIVPFGFDFSAQKFSGDFRFVVTMLDRENTTLAQTSQKVSFPLVGTTDIQFSEISDFQLDTAAPKATATFSFVNRGLDGDFQGELVVYEDSPDRPQVFFSRSAATTVKQGESHTFTISFDQPARPQLYEVEVRVAAKMGEPVTGTLRKNFRVEGAFGELRTVSIMPEKFWREGETVTLSFSGAVTPVNEQQLVLEASVWSSEKGETVTQFSDAIQLYPDRLDGTFSGQKTFPIQHDTGKLTGEIIMMRSGELLGSRQFETLESQKWVQQEGQSDISFKLQKTAGEFNEAPIGQKVAILAGVVGFVLIIVLGIVLARRKRKMLVILFLAGVGIFGGNAFAADTGNWSNTYVEPLPFDAYNSSADEERNWRTIRVSGNIEHNLNGGAFHKTEIDAGKNVMARMAFTPQEGNSFEIEAENFLALSDSAFRFDVVLPGMEEIIDGRYDVHIIFDVAASGDAFYPWVSDEGDSIELATDDVFLDGTAPTLNFYFYKEAGSTLFEIANPENPNPEDFASEVWVEVECMDEGGIGCAVQPTVFPLYQNYCDAADFGGDDSCSGGVRRFEMCDWVGNCTITSPSDFVIAALDTVDPTFSGITLEGAEDGNTLEIPTDGTTIKALASLLFGILDLSDEGGTVDPATMDPACLHSDDFEEINTGGSARCAAPYPCTIDEVTHGFLDFSSGTCEPGECPSGYELVTQDGESMCVPDTPPAGCEGMFPLDFEFCFENQECNGNFPLGFAFCFEPSTGGSTCTPDCSGKYCGDDGCGGSCGTCDAGDSCSSGTCVSSCTPDCSEKDCGDDGCGGSCGTCSAGSCNNGVCVTYD